VLEIDVGWGAAEAPAHDYEVRVALVDDRGAVTHEESFPLSPDWPTSEWPKNAVAWGYYLVHTSPSLPAGDYEVTLALADRETGVSRTQPLPVGRLTVSEAPCLFTIPSQAEEVVRADARFGDELRLLGYQLSRQEDLLTVDLYWRAERRMETAYKVFVHLLDTSTQVPVAQDDAMPRRWTYPTTLWSPGELVTDTILLLLQDVPSGTYGLALGVYDPETAERLPVIDAAGLLQPGGQLMFSQTVGIEE
jgi:hypothetical protein